MTRSHSRTGRPLGRPPNVKRALETAIALCVALQTLARDDSIDLDTLRAETYDYAGALGDYLTGSGAYRSGAWLTRWRGITLD